MSKIVVVGGGASGLLAGICAKNSNNEVILIEKEKSCGKKILVSGNGRCNYFNNDFKLDYYYSSDLDILGEIINYNNKNRVLKLLNSIGIVPRIKDNLYYPYSNQAITIKNTLLDEAVSRGVIIKENSKLIDLKKKNDLFDVFLNNEIITCDKVILSIGSKAFIKDDLDFGYNLLNKLGHKINPVLPGLTGLYCDGNFFKDVSGVRSDVNVKLYVNNSFVKEEYGNIQFTNYGVSGIFIFNLSLIAGKELLNNNKVSLKINFMPDFNFDNISDVISWIISREDVSGKNISFILDSILNYKISNIILKLCKIDGNKLFSELSSYQKELLASYIISFPLDVIKTNDFLSSQVCVGGVSLKDIDIHTMESKVVSNLYITGEILDVCGICGGYNIGFAFLSGMLAGYSAGGLND